MPLYRYRARDAGGNIIEETREAASRNKMLQELRNRELLVINIAEEKETKSHGGKAAGRGEKEKKPGLLSGLLGRNRLTMKDLSLFCRQLGFMMESGVPLLSALNIVGDNKAKQVMSTLSAEMANDLTAGSSFGEAVKRQEDRLHPLMVDMIAAGETGGFLDRSLINLANYFDREVATNEKVKTAMIYPIIITIIAILAVIIVFIFVVPVFAGMLDDMGVPLPFITQIMVNTSSFLNRYWYIVFGLLFILFVGGGNYLRTPAGRRTANRIALRVPGISGLYRKNLVTRFARTLGNLIRAGVPILDSLEVVGKTVGNEELQEEIEEARRKVQDGANVTESFRDSKIIPPLVTQMLAVGEESGTMDEMMEKISVFYDREVEAAAERLPKTIEPVMIVFLGFVVGLIVVGVVVPMFTVVTHIG